MSEEVKVIKTYVCSSCAEACPASDYSKKQLKKKGKRKCHDCASGLSKVVSTPEEGKMGGLLGETGNEIVKHANWTALQKAQRNKQLVLASPENDVYDTLLKWLQTGAQPSRFPHLQLKYYTQDYRGVHAKCRLDPGQCILEVPLTHIMTTNKAKESKIGLAIAAAGPNVLRSSHSWLAAHLLQEKYDPTSYWKPYLDTLPQHYRNMPVFFDETELKELQGSFSLNMIENRKVSLKYEYDEICKAVPEFRRFKHLEFVWARLAVITRIFGFEVKGAKTDGLVPMADMLNHKRPQESTWSYSNAKKAFTITTTKRLLKGSQIFDSYGRKCNSRYFVNYGFALAENEDNQVNFQFKLQPESKDPLQPVKVKILGGDSRSFQIPFDHCEAVTVRCMSYLRVVYANEEELQTILKECKGDYSSVAPVNARNEAAVLKELAKQALITLKGFPTTLERDNELLKDPNNELTMNVRNCIIMRRGEKQVCHAYIDLAPLAQKWKDMAVKPFKKSFNAKVRGNGLEPSIGWRTEQYVQQVWFPFWTGEKVEIAVTSNAHEGD